MKTEAHDGAEWNPQAEMSYDDLGERLSMTAFAGEQNVLTHYALNNGQVLEATAADSLTGENNTTTYLYGLGPIGELTDAWAYGLPDGANTQRQVSDANGEITLAASYNPWGGTLSINGTGKFMQGYFGGMTPAGTSGAGVDTATSLIGLYPEFIEGWATASIMTRKPAASSTATQTPIVPIPMCRGAATPAVHSLPRWPCSPCSTAANAAGWICLSPCWFFV